MSTSSVIPAVNPGAHAVMGNESDAAAIIRTMRRLDGAEVFERDGIAYAVLPEGKRVESLKRIFDEYAPAPDRICGVATLTDERSFVRHVNEFRNHTTRIFANPSFDTPALTAVYDYHAIDAARAQLPAWQAHRAVWALKMSKEWRAWSKATSEKMAQGEFAEFLDRHVPDVYWGAEQSDYTKLLIQTLELKLATPSSLIALSRNLAINVETRVKQVQTLSSGEMSLVYDEQHSDGEGQPIKVPNAFLIAIPVIHGGPAYQILVRMRYRVTGPKITWSLELHRADVVFDAAMQEICTRVETETGCPVFLGSPEK